MDVAVCLHRHLSPCLSIPNSSDLLETQPWLSHPAWLATAPYEDFGPFSEEFTSFETTLSSSPDKAHTGVANEDQRIANLAPQLWSPIMEEELCAWSTLQSSTFPQDMDFRPSDDLENSENAVFLVEPSLASSFSNTRNLETVLDEVFLTPEDVFREFETQSAEKEPAPGLSGTTQETVVSIAIIAPPSLPLDSEVVSADPSSVAPAPSQNTIPASGSLQQVNVPEILSETPALSEIRLSLHSSDVGGSLKTVPAKGITLEISENEITETSLVDKDSRPRMMRSEGLQEPTECEADQYLSLTCSQSYSSPYSATEPPKLPERVEMVGLADSIPGVFVPANNFVQSTKPCPARARPDLPSLFQALSHTAMPNTRPIDDDTPLGERNLSHVEERSVVDLNLPHILGTPHLNEASSLALAAVRPPIQSLCTFSEDTSPQTTAGANGQALMFASLSSDEIEPCYSEDHLSLVTRDRPLASPEARCPILEESKKIIPPVSRNGRRCPPFRVPHTIHLSYDDVSQADPQESGSRDQRGATSDDPISIDDNEHVCRLELEAGPRRHGSQSRKRSNANLNQEERDGPEPPRRKRRKVQTFTQPDGLSEGSTRAIRRQPRMREDYVDYSKDKAIAQEIFEDNPSLDDLLDQASKNFTLAAQSQAADVGKRRESNKSEADKRFRQQWEEIMESSSSVSEKQKSFQKALDKWSKRVMKPRDIKRAVK